MKKLFKRIDESLYDASGRISHTKISSYIILLGIYVSSLMFLLLDIVNAFITWFKGNVYEIPGAHIGIFTLLLGHHLALLGIKKYSETQNMKANDTSKQKAKEEKEEVLTPTNDSDVDTGAIEEEMI